MLTTFDPVLDADDLVLTRRPGNQDAAQLPHVIGMLDL